MIPTRTQFGSRSPVLMGLVLAFCAQFVAGQDNSIPVPLEPPLPNTTPKLTVDQVNTVIGQAVSFLKSVNETAVIAVTDREGHILAIFRMNTPQSQDIRISEQATAKARTASFFQSDGEAFSTLTAQFIVQSNFPPGIRNVDAGPLFGVPFSNFPGGDVQLQVPPSIVFVNPVNTPYTPALLPAPPGMTTLAVNTQVRPLSQPLVITPLTDDPGGMPLFVGKQAAGGVGIEIDGFGVLQNGVPDAGVMRDDTGIIAGPSKRFIEEAAAIAASRGFEPPPNLRGNKIVVNGFRFPYQVSSAPKTITPVTDLSAEGKFEAYFDTDGSERSPGFAPLATAYTGPFGPIIAPQLARAVLQPAAPRGTPDPEFPRRGFVPRFPPRASPLGTITEADVRTMIQQAANQAAITRGAIRQPKGAAAAVWITVVDLAGNICGVFRTEDATVFSFDLCVQKARTAAFFSTDLVGFSSRAIGFMSQTYYPPGVSQFPPGPLSGLNPNQGGDVNALGMNPTDPTADRLTEISQLLTDKTTNTILASITIGSTPQGSAIQGAVQLLGRRIPHIRDGRISPLQAAITVDLGLRQFYNPPLVPPPTLRDGITLFPGGVPIYKNGKLCGGLGISGDGVDQDDIIAFNGHRGFEPPQGVFCDQAPEAAITLALKQAVQKLKVEFPTLTNGKNSVIDVIETRLTAGPVLENLRLPYVKFPRSANRGK